MIPTETSNRPSFYHRQKKKLTEIKITEFSNISFLDKVFGYGNILFTIHRF